MADEPAPRRRGRLVALLAVLLVAAGGCRRGRSRWCPRTRRRRGATCRSAVAASAAVPTVAATVPVGPAPGYMEIAPNGAYAYIASRASGTLTVFDTVRNVVTGRIPVPDGGPQFVAFSPDGARAYVSIYSDDGAVNEVGVLDTATAQFTARIPVGKRPFALDVLPDGSRVYVPNHDSSSISVIDTARAAVVDTIAVAPNPHWVDVSRDGTRLYAANHESNVISVIDTATDRVLTTVPVGISPHSVLAHPDLPYVYNVNYDDNTLRSPTPPATRWWRPCRPAPTRRTSRSPPTAGTATWPPSTPTPSRCSTPRPTR